MKLALIIMGEMNVGKDTLALQFKALAEAEGRTYERRAFADPLKRIVADIACLGRGTLPSTTLASLHDQAQKLAPYLVAGNGSVSELPCPKQMGFGDVPLTRRRLLQWLGTDVLRAHLGADVFIHAATHDVTADVVAFTDARFANEVRSARDAMELRGYKVVVIRVTDPCAVNNGPVHVSETDALVSVADDVTVLNTKADGLGHLAATAAALWASPVFTE